MSSFYEISTPEKQKKVPRSNSKSSLKENRRSSITKMNDFMKTINIHNVGEFNASNKRTSKHLPNSNREIVLKIVDHRLNRYY